MKRLKRVVLFVVKSVAVLILVLVVVGGILRVVWGRQYEAQLSALKAKGEPLTFEQLRGAKIPDSENAAVVYDKIYRQQSSQPQIKRDLERIGWFGNPDERKKNPKLWSEAEQILARNQALLAQMKEAVVSRPRYQVLYDPKLQDDYYARFTTMRGLVRFACADAILKARAGKMNEAVESLDLACKTANVTKGDQMVIAYLFRCAGNSIALLGGVFQVLQLGNISEPQAKRLFETINSADLMTGFAEGMRGERVFFLTDPANSRLMASPLPLAYADGSAYLRSIQKQIDGSSLSWKDAKSKGLVASEDSAPSYFGFTTLMIPVWTHGNERRFRTQADNACACGFLAVQAYRARFGAYPATLADAESKLGWTLPKDPFSGKDLLYKRQGKGFVVYSVGPDMKDDGGTESDKAYNYPKASGDLVWDWSK